MSVSSPGSAQAAPTLDFQLPESRVTVLYADDHPILHGAVARLLHPWAVVLPLVTTIRELDARIQAATPFDVLLLDLMFGEESSLDRIPRYLRRLGQLRIVMFTGHESQAACQRALQLGAVGYVLKSDAVGELRRAMAVVLAGDQYISPILRQPRVLGRNEAALLTTKRREILALLRRGLSYKEIAFVHGITLSGVEYHVRAIKQALGLPPKDHVDWRSIESD